MGKKILPTYQAYYVDMPVVEVKRFFVRDAVSRENAKERVANNEGIVAEETVVVRRTIPDEDKWNARPLNKLSELDAIRYEIQ